MFDLSWSHIGLFIVIALLVLGPKELPNAIRTGAQLLRTGRKLAGEFRSGMGELMREAELEETRQSIKQAVTEGLDKTLEEHVDSTGELKTALESPGVEAAGEPVQAISPGDSKPAELPGPPNLASANIVINDPPPAPPNSIVPPPAEQAIQPAAVADTRAPDSAPKVGSIEADSEELKKTA
jgi:sec-independent protein translocase protein TatB